MDNGNTMKNVLIVAYIFPPLAGSGVQRTLKFVNYLRSFGWKPIVVTTGQLNFPQIDYTLVDEIPKDVQVIRINEQDSLTGDDIQNIIKIYDDLIKDKTILDDYLTLISGGRAALVPDNCISWANNVIKQIDTLIDINKIDMIYTTSGPYSDHIVGYYLKKKFNKPWVADFRDEWTNNAYSNVDKQSLLYKVHYGMEETIVNSADAVIATTPLASDNYATIFDLPKEKVFTITNGYDEKDFEKIEMENLEIEHDKFTIIHNGLLYLIRTPDTFLNAIHNLIKKGLIPREKIRVQFIGTKDDGKWEKYISDLKLGDIVEFSDYLSHKESLKKAASADVLLLIVGSGEKNKSVYPGKIFEYLRLGKPIISLSPIGGVVDELIKKTNRGYNVDFHDISAIEEAIYELYNKWNNNKLLKLPVNSDIRQFERRELTRQLVSIFHKVLAMQQIKKKNDLILQDVKKTVKHFLELGNIEQAKQNINHNLDLLNIDAELCTMKAVIEIMENKLEDAEMTLKKARKIDKTNVDVLYNLGYIYEQKRLFNEALYYYEEALKYTTDQKFAAELKVIIQKIRKDFAVHLKKRIAFFAIPNGGDKFLGDIIAGLSDEYEIKKIIVYDLKQIDKGMEWADICWFEWCDQLIAYGSKLNLAREKPIICRIHGYEAYSNNATQVCWENVDKLIVVANHLVDVLQMSIPNIKEKVSIEVIQNGVDLDKYTFSNREKGFNIAYVGAMIYGKNPFFMLQIMKKLVEKDKRYKLYIAGQFMDPIIKIYWDYQVKELNLQDNICFEGWQDNINVWLEDKNYLLAPSIRESFGFYIAEAMAKGIKPIIHNFPFSKETWDERYLFNTIDEAVQMIDSDEYNSEEYRRFIEFNYSLDKQIEQTKKVLNNLTINKDKSVIDFNYRDVKIKFFLPNLHDHIQKIIYLNKTFYESEMLEDIRNRIEPDSVIFDVGANIGNHSIYFAKICSSRVYSFEPQKSVFAILERNVMLNQLENQILLFNTALGSTSGRGNILVEDTSNLGSSRVVVENNGDIQIDSLDSLMLDKIDRVDLIKIDVEGMELDVLKGSVEILNKFKPLLYIETKSQEDFNRVYSFLKKFGYKPKRQFNATPTILFEYEGEF